MRLKSLLLLIFLTQIFGVSVIGQQSNNVSSSIVEKKDSIQTKTTKGIVPAFTQAEITPSSDRESAPVLEDKMDSRKSIFYSNAKMYVAKNTADDASMFVQGTAKFDNEAAILQVGETSLTGDFVSLKDVSRTNQEGTVTPLFVKHADNAQNTKGIVKFVGQWNKQYVVREDLAGVRMQNDETNSKKVGSSAKEYVIEFPNLVVEKEGLKKYTDIPADKTIAGVASPYVYDVEKMGFVSVNSNVAMSVENLDITKGNRFSIDVVSDGLEKGSALNTDYYKLNAAYVDIKAMEGYNATTGVQDPAKIGHSEVNMRLYDFNPAFAGTAQDDPKVIATNTHPVMLEKGSTVNASFLRGFTSPFNNLRADYMFFHVLTRPSASSITSHNGPISNPTTPIETGAGHFMGMDVSTEYFSEIETNWSGISSTKRARGGYNLSRVVQRVKDGAENTKKFSLFTFDESEAGPGEKDRKYETQRFNVGEVKVRMNDGGANGQHGLYFLGNPFMTPINISGILAENTGGAWKTNIAGNTTESKTPFSPLNFGDDVLAVHELTPKAIADAKAANKLLLRSKYWVVHSALIANTQIGGLPAYAYNVKYDNVAAVGEAPTVQPDMFNRYIEPMQMFLVQTATAGEFVFTQKMKTFTGKAFPIAFHPVMPTVPETGGPRSLAKVAEDEFDEFLPEDWIVIEASVNDGKKATVDRTAVRFFNLASQQLEGYDVLKNIYEGADAKQKVRKGDGIAAGLTEAVSPTNMLYTTALNGEKLLSNGVGYQDTKQVPLYYIASDEIQDVTFTVNGIDGFERVGGVWLVDRLVNSNGEEYIEQLHEGSTYNFKTMPGVETTDNANRFFLRFGEDTNGEGPSLTDAPITCYYSGSTLHIGGLNAKDVGSQVQIFDLQGRLMGNTVVNDYPLMDYPKPLGQGTFIVNITGERNYKTKFVNLQNY